MVGRRTHNRPSRSSVAPKALEAHLPAFPFVRHAVRIEGDPLVAPVVSEWAGNACVMVTRPREVSLPTCLQACLSNPHEPVRSMPPTFDKACILLDLFLLIYMKSAAELRNILSIRYTILPYQ